MPYVFTNDQLKAALTETAGLPALAAKKLGVTRQAVHARIKGSPEIRRYIEELGETLIDAAEAVVADAIMAKDKRMARWFLERKGKERGYTTRVEASGPGGAAIPVAASVKVVIEYKDPEEVVL